MTGSVGEPNGFWTTLPPAERDALLACGRRRTYPRGAPLFHEGDRSDFVVAILEGRVKIVVHGLDGTETLLSVRGPGAILGELAAVDRAPRLATALALEPLQTQVVQADEFRAFVAAHPATGLTLMRTLVSRLREADRRRAEFGAVDVVGRLAHLLAELGAPDGQAPAGPVDIHLSQHELARMIGASRESAARALSVLRAQRVVSTGRKTICVIDLDRLRDFAP